MFAEFVLFASFLFFSPFPLIIQGVPFKFALEYLFRKAFKKKMFRTKVKGSEGHDALLSWGIKFQGYFKN